jgi:hypothetical protein
MFCPGAAVKQGAPSNDSRVYVIDGADGKLVNTLWPELSIRRKPGAARRPDSRMMTPAVMTNGRILMEKVDGVAVYGGGN